MVLFQVKKKQKMFFGSSQGHVTVSHSARVKISVIMSFQPAKYFIFMMLAGAKCTTMVNKD